MSLSIFKTEAEDNSSTSDENVKNNTLLECMERRRSPCSSNTEMAKCGDILVSEDGTFTFYCVFCEITFASFTSFSLHVLDIHLDEDGYNYEDNNSTVVDEGDTTKPNLNLENFLDNYYNESNDKVSKVLSIDNENNFEIVSDSDSVNLSLPHVEDKYSPNVYEKSLVEDIESLRESNRPKDNHPPARKYKCEYCDGVFTTSSNRNTHMRIHLNDKRYKCDFCDKPFIRKTDCQIHMRSHTGERPYQCEVCGQSFGSSGRLSVHKKRHSGDKPFPCDICGKTFKANYRLNAHKVLHSDLRPFSCDECGATFTRKKTLKMHEQIHLPVKRYKCLICDKAFAQHSGLYSHRKTHGVLTLTKPKVEENSFITIFKNYNSS